MKIISWNCNGALRKKFHELNRFDADILVIQECENPEHSSEEYRQWAGNYLWIGKNKNRGLAVFSKKGHLLTKLHWTGEYKHLPHRTDHVWTSEKLESFLPCLIDGEIPLLAVWTKKADSPNFGYIGQFWMYLQIHREKLRGAEQIICGDFNSNAIWDSWDRWWNHSDVVRELSEIGLESVYHVQTGENEGEESVPTFYLQRKLEKSYHIDYFFVNQVNLKRSTIELLPHDYWLKLSDHIPLMLEIQR